MTNLEKRALILLTKTETNQVAGGDKGNHYGQKRDPGVRIGAFSPVGPSLACGAGSGSSKWMTTRYTLSKWMTTRTTFGHQPHALLSRSDLATKHRSCRLPG